MSKNLRKTLALMLVLVMAFAALAAGCAKKDPAPAPAPDGGNANPQYYIGINVWGSGVPILDMFGDEKEYALGLLGQRVTRMSDDYTAEKELQNIQNMIAGGVNGIVAQGSAVSTVPEMVAACESAKVPIVFDVFIGDDKDIAEFQKTKQYYVGAVDADMVYDGKLIGQLAYENGCRKAVLIGGNIGDNNMDQRSQGFRESFEALGGVVLDEARCSDNSECATKAEDMLSANMDADCLYAFVGDYIAGSLTAIDHLGLGDQVKVYLSCVDKDSANYIKEGRIVAGNDGIAFASSIAPCMLLNALDGHKILDANGQPPRFRTHPFTVDKDNVDAYISVFYADGVHPFTAELLNQLCWRTNPDVSYQTYVDFIDNLTLNKLLEAHGLPTIG